ncbi:YdcF family protein [Azospirillum sp.]|uniref:YdcF family protein n=1 Tax=Azospirillum sp. TaxID=34012 RepID=UPI002D60DC20|nr:YdcF family protein [Azospirillum sp.]HYD64307.1 YdcF family protein [Azospirillum sp.]
MDFIASKVLLPLALPGNLLTVLLIAGCALLFRSGERARRVGRRLVVLSAAGFLAFAVLPVADWLALPLESRFPRPALPDRVDGVIVLGGAVSPALAAARGEPSVNDAAERVLAFADLGRRYPDARLVFTGGSGSLWEGQYREGSAMRAALGQAGLDAGRVLFETESRNTWENVRFSRRFAEPKDGETWLLVTSAWHMPRAVGLFRQAGWPVTAYPVDYRTRGDGRPYLILDLGEGLDSATPVLKEWIGLVAYRLMGRTDALFPAP